MHLDVCKKTQLQFVFWFICLWTADYLAVASRVICTECVRPPGLLVMALCLRHSYSACTSIVVIAERSQMARFLHLLLCCLLVYMSHTWWMKECTTEWVVLSMFGCYAFVFFIPWSLSSSSASEHGGQRSHLHHLLPSVSSHAAGQAPQQRGGHSHAALDFHQILPGEA